MILTTLIQSFEWLVVKMIYRERPDLEFRQILFVRVNICMMVLSIYLNKQLPYVLFGCFTKQLVPKFILRISCGVLMISNILYSAKFFPLTTIAVV